MLNFVTFIFQWIKHFDELQTRQVIRDIPIIFIVNLFKSYKCMKYLPLTALYVWQPKINQSVELYNHFDDKFIVKVKMKESARKVFFKTNTHILQYYIIHLYDRGTFYDVIAARMANSIISSEEKDMDIVICLLVFYNFFVIALSFIFLLGKLNFQLVSFASFLNLEYKLT